jgi:outer membrane protein insertion porin family
MRPAWAVPTVIAATVLATALVASGAAQAAPVAAAPPAREQAPSDTDADAEADTEADASRGVTAAGAESAGAPGSAQPGPASFDDPAFGPRYVIERIEVRGNRKTEAALILGEIDLRAGDEVTASDRRVEAARFRLLSLGYFFDARLALEKGSKRGAVVLVVEVEERGTVIINALHLGTSTATTFWGGLEVAETNLLGRGISLGGGFVGATRSEVQGAGRGFGSRVRASVPALAGTGLSLSVTGLYARGSEFFRSAGPDTSADPDDFVALRLERVGGLLGVGRALTRTARVYLDFRQEGVNVELPDTQVRTEGPGVLVPIDFGVLQGFSRVGSLTATLDIDTRSDPLIPRAGSRVALSVEAAGRAVGSGYEFLKAVLQASHHRRAWRGHIVGLHLFGGAILGDAPYFDRFFVGDLNPLLPPRALGLNFSTQPSRDLLGTSIASHRYDNFAGRIMVEYAVPLWRRRGLVYSGDLFGAAGVFGMGSRGAFRDPQRSGLGAWPVDLTLDLGMRLDTYIGVFTLSIANALGRLPF